MIKVKMIDIINAQEKFKEISNYDFPARTSFKIARILRVLQEENASFEQAKMLLFNKYGEKDPNGNLIVKNNQVNIKKEFLNNYNQEIRELLTTSVELAVEPINIDELADITCSPSTLMTPFIEE